MKKYFIYLIPAAFAALLLTGCMTGPHPATIQLAALDPDTSGRFDGNTPLSGKVALGNVGTEGNRNLMGLTTSARIDEFRAALERSLHMARLAAAPGSAAYTLNASVTQVEQPMSLDSIYNINVTYTLVRNADGKETLHEPVFSSHTATASDTLYGSYRDSLAMSGAFRKNITQIIEKLYKADVR